MGARVRAADGTMQPQLTSSERAAIRSIRQQKREWAEKVDHVSRTISAINALAENRHDPETVVAYAAKVFSDPEIRKNLDAALQWLKRFAEVTHAHETHSHTESPEQTRRNDKKSSSVRYDHIADSIRV
jgi:hypothetical protein